MSLGPAWAAEAPAFPSPGAERAVLLQWLSAHTRIRPETLIALAPEAAFALLPGGEPPGAAGLVRRTIREEALSASFAATMRGRSSLQVLDFDCRRRRFKPVSISIYEGADLQGYVERVGIADEWTDDMPGTYMAEYFKAVCDPGFKFPLAAASPARPPSAPPGSPPRAAQAVPQPATTARITADAPPGAWVQIGAYRSANEATAAVSALAQARGRPGHVQRIDTSAGALFRALVGGFSGPSEARSFCQALKASGRDCIVR